MPWGGDVQPQLRTPDAQWELFGFDFVGGILVVGFGAVWLHLLLGVYISSFLCNSFTKPDDISELFLEPVVESEETT